MNVPTWFSPHDAVCALSVTMHYYNNVCILQTQFELAFLLSPKSHASSLRRAFETRKNGGRYRYYMYHLHGYQSMKKQCSVSTVPTRQRYTDCAR